MILKALSGTQSGVEVALVEGEYTLGSGQDDDLQFVDVCLKSGHARIRVEDQKTLVAGGAGSVVNQAGVVIDAGDDEWRELAALEVITIGSSSFAIGSADANWADLTASLDRSMAAPRNPDKIRPGKRHETAADSSGRGDWMKYGAAAASLVVLVAAIFWLTLNTIMAEKGLADARQSDSLDIVRAALDQHPFGKSIDLRQEVDDAIYATGYVEKPVERRALHNAVAETGIPVNLRLWVLSSIETQIDAAIESFDVGVQYDLSQEGVASFEGEILSDEAADRFFTYVRDEISGISLLNSSVHTASSFYDEVMKLAARSGINNTVLFRLVDQRIEASGVVVTDKLDAWVGFLQAYARRYADHISLTSYVQLVNEQGQVIAQPSLAQLGAPELVGRTRLPGEQDAPDQTAVLDLARVKQGSFGASDIFQGIDDGLITNSVPDDRPSGPRTGTPSDTRSIADSRQKPKLDLATAHVDLSSGIRRLLDAKSDQERTSRSDDTDPSGYSEAGPAPVTGPQDETVDRVLEKWDRALANGSSIADSLPIGFDLRDDVALPGQEDMPRQDNLPGREADLPGSGGRPDELVPPIEAALPDNPAARDETEPARSKAGKSKDRILSSGRARYLPLVLNPISSQERCWDGSLMKISEVPIVLFWLDYLSLTKDMSLVDFDQANQYLLLEAALNPDRTRRCAQQMALKQGVPFDKMSLYLDEAERNPLFIRFLVRDFQAETMEVAGVMLRERGRFIQMRDGTKVREGSSPNVESKLASVGALGALLQRDRGLTPIIYSENLAWKMSN
ncbi:FHA domain-containing protein [Roseibium sp.]|uniref:FHA domain-containing protein n=1 Tax=Roseibium sp. TaxID=1936156 RepID=UPI003267BE4F